jgi:hypothetical protein
MSGYEKDTEQEEGITEVENESKPSSLEPLIKSATQENTTM